MEGSFISHRYEPRNHENTVKANGCPYAFGRCLLTLYATEIAALSGPASAPSGIPAAVVDGSPT